MGEIKIGINAKRNRMGKLVSMESAERRQSKIQYKFFGGEGGGCASCVMPLPNNMIFPKHWLLWCGTNHLCSFRLAARSPQNIHLSAEVIWCLLSRCGIWKRRYK
jgi:hypothetical protein